MADGAALIGIDWGTTSFRAYRIGADGAALATRTAPAGILKVPSGDFEAVLEREVGDWLGAAPALPVVVSGMITSRQGWLEVPYCACPAGSVELAGALGELTTGAGRRLHFVPGVSLIGSDGVPDVIRGEETQIIGQLAGGRGGEVLLLPGTHSKWAFAADGRIVWFATFMTGELFAVLSEHSILGRLMAAGAAPDETAFARGLSYAREGPGGLLKRLFSARTLGLFDQLPASAIGSYLSGLLIGSELAEALACLPQAPGAARDHGDRRFGACRALSRRHRGRRLRCPHRGCRCQRPWPAADRPCRRPGARAGAGACWASVHERAAAAPPALAADRDFARHSARRGAGDRRGADRRGLRRHRGAAQLARAARQHRAARRRLRRARADRRRDGVAAGAGAPGRRGRRPADRDAARRSGGDPRRRSSAACRACPGSRPRPRRSRRWLPAPMRSSCSPPRPCRPRCSRPGARCSRQDVWLLPVGGIAPQSMAPYLAAGANGFGLGSALYRAGMQAAEVAERARAFADAYAAPGGR